MESIKHKMSCLIKERGESMVRAVQLEAEKEKAEKHATNVCHL